MGVAIFVVWLRACGLIIVCNVDETTIKRESEMRAKRITRTLPELNVPPVNDYEITHDGSTYDVLHVRRGHFKCEINGTFVFGSLRKIKERIADAATVSEMETIDVDDTVVPKSRPTWLSLSPAAVLGQLALRGCVPDDLMPQVYETLDCAGLLSEPKTVDREAVEAAVALYERTQTLRG